MKAVPDEPSTWGNLRPELRESWRRSAAFLSDPGAAQAPVEVPEDDLVEIRQAHPLRLVLPVFDQLLIRPAAEAGLIVAIGDAEGRLLWVDGDRGALRRAESSAFQPGARWSEQAIGTSAPGVALATGRGAQVHQEEHFALSAHQFSCSAAPIRNPHTGAVLGVVDLTGDEKAVATHSLPLIYAAISAAEAELKVLPADSGLTQLITLGTTMPLMGTASDRVRLGLRHAEILTLLAWHGGLQLGTGLSCGELAELLFGEPGHEVTLRAEVVRLRRMLRATPAAGGADLVSKPYRLDRPVELDAVLVHQALVAGQRQLALDIYGGPLLPASEAPGVVDLRRQLSVELREAVLSDGTPQELWRYLQLPEAADDEEVIYTALRVLPADSPQRAALVARMQR
ncbi:GAF domain-containing protein [Nesterenkonia flava]|uniref:GAF domain-containing protein n=1 Tax=Nesterenkonia flava TaxID=469799 RepID=A0ABU1FSW4_9MICC|nr:GAF domain-containing protein [Nesterenkonia flava]MDR5711759.1 GAF domain-containing protein [Nesterenkonia flava]